VPVAAGNRLPGVPAYSGYAELRWRPGWADWQLEWRAQSKLYVVRPQHAGRAGYGSSISPSRASFRPPAGPRRGHSCG